MDSMDYGVLTPAWAGSPVSKLASDAAFVQAMLDVESAWVKIQASAELCTVAEAHAVAQIARVELYDLELLASRTPDGANALIPLLGMMREQLKAHQAPASAASALHRGATSQDIIDSALMLMVSRVTQSTVQDLRRTATALANLAEAHRTTTCVARSLTQHALPITFGLRASNWLSAIRTATDQLEKLSFPLQWGGAVGTLASLEQFLHTAYEAPSSAELTADLARELNLEHARTPWHTNRIPLTTVASALAAVTAALGTFGADVLTASRPEIAELSEPREAGKGGSSAMPQKQNPVHSVLLRNAALSSPGLLAIVFTAAGTAVDERPDGGWHSEWSALRELLRLASGAAHHAATLAEGLGVHPERMAQNMQLSGDALLSERIATVLAPTFPGGKPAIQQLVIASLGDGPPLRQLLREQLSEAEFSEPELDQLLDPADYLGATDRYITHVLAEYSAWKESWQSQF